MQVLPSTAEEIARESGGQDFMPATSTTRAINILYGSYYLRGLLDHYDGDEVAAVAAYNAGQGNVDAWLRAAGRGHGSARLRHPVRRDARIRPRRRAPADVYRRAYGSRLGPAP